MHTKPTLFTFLIVVLVALTSSIILAQEGKKVYISDVVYVPMRSGHSNEYRIINKGLKSGTELIQLDVNEDNTWSKVVTDSGVEGWVPNQYLTEEPTAQIQLNKSLARLTQLDREIKELKAENQQLKQQNAKLSSTASTTSKERSELAEELERVKQISANAINLDQRYRDLLEKYELTLTQRDSLQAENQNLKSDKTLSFMFYGAGLLVLGMLMAVVLPALKPKKRYSDWA